MPTPSKNRQVLSVSSQVRHLSFWEYGFVVAFVLVGVCLRSDNAFGQGADGGKVDGALWSFQMTPNDKILEKRTGMFRINGNDIFQRSNMEKPGFDRKVGTKSLTKAPRNKKGKLVGPETTIIEFFDLQSNGQKHTGMKGKVILTKNKLGEWSGRYIDGEGLHWQFKCSRKQE